MYAVNLYQNPLCNQEKQGTVGTGEKGGQGCKKNEKPHVDCQEEERRDLPVVSFVRAK